MCACAVSFALMAGLCACGGGSEETVEDTEKLVAQEIMIATGSDRPAAEDSDEDEAETTKTTAVSDVSVTTAVSVKTTAAEKTTTAAGTTKKSQATTTKKNSSGNTNSNSGNSNSSGSSNSGSGSNSNANSGGSSDTGHSGGSQQEAVVTTHVTTAPPETTTTTTTTTTVYVAPEDVDKYVDFGVIENGDGYTYDGYTLNISTPGSYHLSGTLNGMIYVNVGAEDKVKLRLNGVGITNTGAPCIQVENADKVIVNVVDGSSNYLECYSTNAEGDASLYSKDDLKIKGCGYLYVFCDNEHGIACNNDLEIEETELVVDAEKTGISSHKSIQINSGYITTSGDNCGIRSWDSIYITGGIITACGGKKAAADRGGIISDTNNFYIEGGTVFAVGMNQTLPGGQNSALAVFPGILTKENTVGVSIDGMSLASALPNKKYNCILISDPNLYSGGTCDVWLNDEFYDNFVLNDGVTQVTLDGVTE